jgi:UPF0176 protein
MVINISAYKFVELAEPAVFQRALLAVAEQQNLMGTVLLSIEGINLNLAGGADGIKAFQDALAAYPEFAGIPYKTSESDEMPFQRLVVKIKPEIITLRSDEQANPLEHPVAYVTPETLKSWYDEGREFTVLDARNAFEVEYGTFERACDLDIEHFSEFPRALAEDTSLDKNKPLVTFCTGGVRCEKAGIVLEQAGFKEVYQLDGGILNYFEQCGGDHYDGNCFVFDERVALDPQCQVVDDAV